MLNHFTKMADLQLDDIINKMMTYSSVDTLITSQEDQNRRKDQIIEIDGVERGTSVGVLTESLINESSCILSLDATKLNKVKH